MGEETKQRSWGQIGKALYVAQKAVDDLAVN